jgi:choice-of-anchor B domain-containing protein
MQARYRSWVRFVVSIFAVFSVLWLFLAQPSPSLAGADNNIVFRAQPTPTPLLVPPDDATANNADLVGVFANDGKAVCGFDTSNLVAQDLPFMPMTACSNGSAGGYPCNNVDLMSFLPLAQMGGSSTILASSLWGWTDPQTGREYALVGLRNKTSFVDITDPTNPIYLGNLPTHTGTSSWRELKTYGNYAMIVSDNNGNHGIQIFDLTRLRNVTSPPVTFTQDAHYNYAGSIHNIWINQQTGFAYAVGTSSGTQRCSSGVHIVNVQNPLNPTFSACYPATATTGYYTHDIDCMVYNGPDPDYQGREICIASDGKASNSNDTMAILDVTNKNNIVQIARVSYANDGFIHQTDFTEDMRYLVLDDETDETGFGTGRRTHIYNMTNLDSPQYMGYYQRGTAIDHNQYVKGNYLYQANYTEGLNVYNLNNISSATLNLEASFDIYPSNNNASFNGAWNVYPYFNSGNVILSGIEQGLFVLRPNLSGTPPTATPVPPTPTRTPTGVPPTATRTPSPVPPTNTPTGPTATPGGSITYTGTLPGTGSNAYHPTEGYSSGAGVHTGDLNGTGSDFDLYLQRWNGSSWATVASGTSSDSTEFVSYNGTAGTYRWRVYSYSGSGSYTLVTTRPSGTSPTSTPVPATPTPGSGGTTYTGTLPGTGSNAYHPSSGYSSGAGVHTGDLSGTGSDFDLYLQRWNGSSWATVASGTSSDSTEFVSYNGTAGTYRWRVYSYSGSGSYTLVTTRPTSLTSGEIAPALPPADAPEDKPIQNK